MMTTQFMTLSTLLLLALLAVAVVSDARQNRIPNWIAGGVLVLRAASQTASDAWAGLGLALLGAAVALLFFLPFHVRGAMGAGDVKLMAAAGAWLGPLGAVLGCAVTLLMGLVLGLMALVLSASPSERPALHMAVHWLPARLRGALIIERQGQLKVPYAGAIAAGVTLSAWQLGKLSPVTGLMN
jgi:prepilin peptidase CpaA